MCHTKHGDQDYINNRDIDNEDVVKAIRDSNDKNNEPTTLLSETDRTGIKIYVCVECVPVRAT